MPLLGSEEELADLKTAYMEGEGDMGVIIDSVLCCTAEDEDRFAGILTDLIHAGELPEFDAFMKESVKKKAARQKKVGWNRCFCLHELYDMIQ